MFSPGEGMMPPPDGDMGPPPDEDMGPPPDDMSTNSSQDNEQSQQQSSTSQTSNKVVMTHSSATHKSNQTLKLKSLVYIQGKVSVVMKVSSRKQDNTPGEIMLNLKLVAVDTEHLIMVGPSSYVEKRGFRFTIGDYIKVSGFTVAGEKNTLVAKEITKNKQILKLRNNEGSPLWSL
jgi:hypothetical protein